MRIQSKNAIFKFLRRSEDGVSDVKGIYECITKLPPLREPMRIRDHSRLVLQIRVPFFPTSDTLKFSFKKCFTFTSNITLNCSSFRATAWLFCEWDIGYERAGVNIGQIRK